MAQYVLQPVGHDPYDATPVNGDPFAAENMPEYGGLSAIDSADVNSAVRQRPIDYQPGLGAALGREAGAGLPTSQYQVASLGERLGKFLMPMADSLGNAATLAGRALYGPESAGWDRYGPAKPEEALNAAGWVTMPGLGRAAVALPAERGLGEVLSSGGIKPPVAPTAAPEGLGPSLTAYHGSPHSFDKFDISKIGTGEGVQAYGHGLYFAGNEKVAQGYRDALSRQVLYKDEPIAATHWNDNPLETAKHLVASKVAEGADPAAVIASEAKAWRDNANSYLELGKGIPDAEVEAASFNHVADQIEALDPAGFKKNPGSMYQVQIHADPEHFLDWDKPLSEQHPKVQEAVNSFDIQPRFKTDDPLGQNLYAWASQRKPEGGYDVATTSQRLRDAGIPGIKYLDAGSRGTGEGTHNYVTFSDDIISILKKYGLAGLGLGTGAAAMQGQGDQSQ